MAGHAKELEYEQHRQQYQVLLEDLQEKADSSGAHGVDPDVLRLLMLRGNELFVNVKRPREAALDAQFMKQVSQLTTLNIRSTHASLHEFKPQEFAAKMKVFLSKEQIRPDRKLSEEDFKKAAVLSNAAMRRCPGLPSQLTGFVTKAPKAPVQRQAKVKDKESAKTEMKQVIPNQGEEVQTEEVSRVFNVLKRRFRENANQPLCFFKFVVNPNSFVDTIENVFHTSFLVRDQHARIMQDSNQLPVISPDKVVPGQSAGTCRQMEVSFDVAVYNNCIELFNITEPMIPPRQRN